MAKRTKRLTAQGDEKEEIRINKFLSEAGVCSRREADSYIAGGKVKIDGILAQMGSKVTKGSLVTFCDKPVVKEEKLVLIAFNKPEGIVCTTDQREPDNIIDYINYGMRIYPIGRLDKDSEGLILLTNDGNIVNKILRAENNHEKEYIVTVNKEINQEFINAMSSGVPILDTVTKPCTVKQIDKYTFDIVLTQGLNRQIRRMCEYLGYRVAALRRIRIMNILLGRLKTGDYRNVTDKEIEELKRSFEANKSTGRDHEKAEIIKEDDKTKISGSRTTGNNTQENRVKGKTDTGKRTEGYTGRRDNRKNNPAGNKRVIRGSSFDSYHAGDKATDHKTVSRKISEHRAADRKAADHRAADYKTTDRKAVGHKSTDQKATDHRAADHKNN